MSLYLKYRPQNFASVVGQAHVVQTLQNTLKQNHLAHAYLFCGPRGTGKTSLARIVAKALNCTQRKRNSAEPCHECEICQAINQGRLVDLIEIDAASNRGIDEIRELREKIVFSPTQAKAKVYIIDEVHMLTKEAFNALLKTLEEPPEHAYFILATTEAHKIPETIVSRCQQFTFNRIENEQIVSRLSYIAQEEKMETEENALTLIAKAAHGGLRDAIGLLEQMAASGPVTYEASSAQLGVSGHVVMEKFEEALSQQNPLRAIELLNQIHAQGKSLSAFLEEWVNHLREQMLADLENQVKVKQFIQWIELFTTAKQQLSQAIIPQLPIEVAVIRACDFEVSSKSQAPNHKEILNSKKQEANQVLPKNKESVVVGSEPVSEKRGINEETSKVKPPANQAPPGSPEGGGLNYSASDPKVGVKKDELIVEKGEELASKKDESPQNEEKALPVQNLKLSTLQQKWSELLEAVEIPFIKMSLMDGQPVKVEEEKLYIEFNSSTLMDKVENKANQAVVMKAFEEVFKVKPVLKLSVKKITLSPGVSKVEEKKVEVREVKSKSDDSAVEMAQEVFGIE